MTARPSAVGGGATVVRFPLERARRRHSDPDRPIIGDRVEIALACDGHDVVPGGAGVRVGGLFGWMKDRLPGDRIQVEACGRTFVVPANAVRRCPAETPA